MLRLALAIREADGDDHVPEEVLVGTLETAQRLPQSALRAQVRLLTAARHRIS
jgi:hypothetical protein